MRPRYRAWPYPGTVRLMSGRFSVDGGAARPAHSRMANDHGPVALELGDVLARLRRICSALPEVEERLSHGAPAWFVRGKRMFVTFAAAHHDDRVACWCAAAPGVQEALVRQRPERFFRPQYVGHRGWLGIDFAGPGTWDEVETLVHEAYGTVAPARLSAALRAGHAEG